MTGIHPNFVLLDANLAPDIARLLIATVQARDAVDRRSWSHPQEPITEELWADVLGSIRAREPRNDVTATPPSKRAIGSPTSCARSSSSPAVSAIGRQLFGKRSSRPSGRGLCDADFAQRPSCAGLPKDRRSVGPLRCVLRRADRGLVPAVIPTLRLGDSREFRNCR